MSFQETFSDLRRRRRIPMRLFEERVGINPSYIHSVEKQGLLPTPEKLDLLASVFVEVATEQEAASPEEDARRLLRARDKSVLEERQGLEPGVADAVLALQDLKDDQRADIIEPLTGSIGFFGSLRAQERKALARLLQKVLTDVGPLTGDARTNAILALAGIAEDGLDRIAKENDQEPSQGGGSDTGKAPDRRRAAAARKRRRSPVVAD